MNHCKTCNASHKNTVERVIRCCTCVVQPGKKPTNYRAIKPKLREKNAQPSKPLTDEEIVKITADPCLYIRGGDYRIDIARAIEAAHGIKGGA